MKTQSALVLALFTIAAIVLHAIGGSASAPAGNLRGGGITLADLELGVAEHFALTIDGDGETVAAAEIGSVILSAALEPRIGYSMSSQERLSGVGLRIEINGRLQTTACFLPEAWDNSSGTRCNTKDRRVVFNPPLVVGPGETVTMRLLRQDQGTLDWNFAPQGDAIPFSFGVYQIFPGQL